MNRFNQRGAVNVLLIPLILLIVFFLGAAGFGVWAYLGRADYKNNSDQKVSAAVQKAVKDTQSSDAVQYAEAAKKPFATYIGPAAFGNITINYPKTWSAYVIQADKSSTPVSGYFQPKVVPSITDATNTFALRVDLVQSSYQSVLDDFKSRLTQGTVSSQPFTFPQVPSVTGVQLDGQITPTKQGTMIVAPLRNMTLKIWTESNDFKGDLMTNILPNFSFVP